MSVREVELLELLRDQPELLAIADAVAVTQPRQGTTTRPRVARRLVAVAVLAAAVAGALLLLPQEKNGVVERALAAVGDGPVMHIVSTMPSGVINIDLQSGVRTEPNLTTEVWADQQFKRIHAVVRYQGETVADFLWPDDQKDGATIEGPVSPAFSALWTGYRNALANGTAQQTGEGTEFGHHVYWLRFAAAGHAPPDEVAVDATTFKSVIYRSYDTVSGKPIDQHILTAEATAFAQADFTRNGPNPASAGIGSSTSSSSSSGPLTPTVRPSTVVPSGWLTAGPQADGAPLTAVIPQGVMTTDKQTTKGYQLVYGRLDHGVFPSLDATTIDERTKPDDPEMWQDIPAGSIRIEEGQAGSGGGPSHSTWTGFLIKDNHYLAITSSHGEQAILEIARALHTTN